MQESHIIAQQIDIVVIGARAYQFISIMFGQKIIKSKSADIKSNAYTKIIQNLSSQKIQLEQNQRSIDKKGHGIKKYTKSILTESFWIHIHFFLHDISLFDPLISDFIKGSGSICIIADSQDSTYLSELKSYSSLQNSDKMQFYNILNFKQNSRIGHKSEIICQAQLLKNMHNLSICKFTSVLAIRISDDYSRMVEDSNRLKLTTNQVIRWIVQRHFHNQYGIILKSVLGDELQNHVSEQARSKCALI